MAARDLTKLPKMWALCRDNKTYCVHLKKKDAVASMNLMKPGSKHDWHVEPIWIVGGKKRAA